MPARTIDEVVEQLDDLISYARREKSRLGYFAALYRNVTVKVKEGILAGSFEDGARMERLDVTFANRYLDAVERYRRGKNPADAGAPLFAPPRAGVPSSCNIFCSASTDTST